MLTGNRADLPGRRQLLRTGLAGTLACAGLAGCAPAPLEGGAGAGGGRPLNPVISGGWLGGRADPQGMPSMSTSTRRIFLRQPVGVTVRGVDLYIADAGLQQVLRYDRMMDTLSPLIDLPALVTRQTFPMQIAPDRNLWMVEPGTRRVTLVSPGGRPLRAMNDETNLGAPADLALDAAGNVYVADGLYNHVAVFNPFGRLLRLLGGGGAETGLRSATALAVGRGGVYVVDRAARRVLRFDAHSGATGRVDLPAGVLPGAITIDRHGRVWVADVAARTVLGFDAALVPIAAPLTLPGAAQIAALAADEASLLVADSLGARVLVLDLPAAATAVTGAG